MSPRDLLSDPCWRAADLGQPLPDSPHAVSVALPRWRDVIAYEENDPACRAALRSAYPRFVFHPLVAELAAVALAAQGDPAATAWPYPSRAAAELARDHCRRRAPRARTAITTARGLPCLIGDAAASEAARAFWQHVGLGASSRQAAEALGREQAPSPEEGARARRVTAGRLAEIHGCDPALVRLLPSGMGALHTALRAIGRLRPGRPTLQLGFPYVDVLKLPREVFAGGALILDTDPAAVAGWLDRHDPAAVIVELPSNPMLQCVDLPAVARLCHARGIPLIADDTIGSALNIEALAHADLVFTSLTKSFAGRGDVLAGSLVVSPASAWREELSRLTAAPPAGLGDSDALILERGSRDVRERVGRMDAACLALAARLAEHPAVARVLHPASCPNFAAIRRRDGGHGCLLSFELRGGAASARRVYDALAVSKGPSLGTPFTLACPYVLLAHYHELDWAEACGVPRHLLRVSVGLEPSDRLWQRFDHALTSA